MKRRWFIYIVVGVLFGVFDFYLLDTHHSFPSLSLLWDYIIGLSLTFGLWLVPVVPIIIHETRASHSVLLPALASGLTWCISVIVYYITNIVQLAIGSSFQPWMSLSHHNFPGFWGNWANLLETYILGHILEWTVVALTGGFIIGILISSIYLFLSRNKVTFE